MAKPSQSSAQARSQRNKRDSAVLLAAVDDILRYGLPCPLAHTTHTPHTICGSAIVAAKLRPLVYMQFSNTA